MAQLLALPMDIRGYEQVKSAAAAEAMQRADALLAQLRQPRRSRSDPFPSRPDRTVPPPRQETKA
ncbi:hypothetical protein HK414_06390 [Ramlibacter terrae]|uniref:Uncharacterized protein n=1 Tax=Ramlibacter terrae TaxID=2732511 RepID=A0ABX6P142_9BURK|nr:hypothetical protein HK414_06390 [Ramlibacter terrae]